MSLITKLKAPFPAGDVEWRIQSSGTRDGKVWAMCLAYITNRAIMDRLDETVGAENWRNEYAAAPCGGVMCGLSIRINDEWVTKWDGAENTDIEGVKGGLSGAMKRAGVQWGIGRYLYDLEEGWAKVSESGKHKAKTKDGTWFKWDPPALPKWAQAAPTGYATVGAELVDVTTGAVVEDVNKKPATGHDIERLRSILIELADPAIEKKMDKDERAAAKKAYRLTAKTDAPEGEVLTAFSNMVELLSRLKHPESIDLQMKLVQEWELEAV